MEMPAVAVSAGGEIATEGVLEFAVLNNDYRFLDAGGTIGGDATVNVSAASISAGAFFQPLINNDTGSIGGDATVTVEVKGPTDVGTEGYFRIINDSGSIGGDALFTYISGDVSIGDTLFAEIQNRDQGEIGGDAKLTFTAADLSVENTANFQILNGLFQAELLGGIIGDQFGGQIGGDAIIDVNLANIGATALAANIDNTAGSIGGDAIINFAVTNDIDCPIVSFGIFNSDTGAEGSPGSIGGEAAINLSAGGDLTAQLLVGYIDNQNGGSIGDDESINVDIAGSATVTSDATFEVLGSDGADSAAININGGNYEVGGTFLAYIDGQGTIAFNNASVHADVLKAGVFGTNGVLNIGGGTLSADTTLKLYAPGSNGQLNFISNVTLGGDSAKILAADSITIFNGVVVTVGNIADENPADVYTNHANYSGFGGNGSTTGTFAGSGANDPQPLPSAPPFDDPPRPATGHSSTPSSNHHSGPSGGTPTNHSRSPSAAHVALVHGHHGDSRTRDSRPAHRVIKVSDSDQLLSLLDRTSADGKIAIPSSNDARDKGSSGRGNDAAGRMNANPRAVNGANAASRLP